MSAAELNQRIQDAKQLPTKFIEESLPPSLLHSLKALGQSISASWLGVLLGIISPVQYAMKFAYVKIERSSWQEPTIIWPLLHMSSGTCKSNIHRHVTSLSTFLQKGHDFKPSEITFEKLGTQMQSNNNTIFWYFDEMRLFFANLGLYSKNNCRDEAVLLTLYDGGEWSHSTSKGTQFYLPYTKPVLGGLSQTSHIMSLYENKSYMESGFLPRFLMFMLDPCYTELDDLEETDPAWFQQMQRVIEAVKLHHIDCGTKKVVKYTVYRDTLAYAAFNAYHKKVNNWLREHNFKLHMQNAVTIISKSKGQILRLSAILNAFFLMFDSHAVTLYESNRDFDIAQKFVDYVTANNTNLPISLMAMEASINLVAYSLAQSTILQGIKGVAILLNNGVTFDSEDEHQNQQQQLPLPLLPQQPLPQQQQQQQQQPGTSGYVRSPIHKILTIGGRVISINHIVRNKVLGRENGNSTNGNCVKIFNILEGEGFGQMVCVDTFKFHDDIEQKVTSTDNMKQFMTSHGVSMPKFLNGLKRESKLCHPTSKRMKKEPLKDSSNIPKQIIIHSSIINN